MNYSPIVVPVVALVIWFLLLYVATFVPILFRIIAADPPLTSEESQAIYSEYLAEHSQYIRDQPALFYVVCLALAYVGAGSGWDNWLAWAFAACWATHKLPASWSNPRVRRAAGWVANINLCALAISAGVRVAGDLLTA